MNYLLGFFLVLLSDTIYSISNIFDGELSRKTFSSVWSVVVINGLLTIIALPVVFLVLRPTTISGPVVWVVIIVAFIEFAYQIPYYLAMRHADTSVVVSLFSFGRIFTPLFAYVIVGEILTPLQYTGFAIIVASSIAVSFSKKTFTMSKALYYMIPVTILLAFSASLQKYGLNQVAWKTFFFWMIAASVPFYLLAYLFLKTTHREVGLFLRSPFQKKYLPLYWQNIASWIGGGIGTLALSLLPVSIEKAFGSLHSIIVHVVASKGSKVLKTDAERLSGRKITLFVLIAIGIILTLQ